MKKISKVIIYYDDGTFQEITHSVHSTQDKENKEPLKTSPVIPDLRPDYQQIRDWNPVVPNQPTFVVPNTTLPPWTVTCGTTPFKYTDKYSITSTGNGNVDLSK
jgi:hypothetical protein